VDSLAIAIGGVVGASLRYGLGLSIGTYAGFPLATLLINLTGSLFLAWFYTITSEYVHIHPRLRIAIGTGLVGSYTTFSTFAVETLQLIQNHHSGQAILYACLSFITGLIVAYLGYKLAVYQKNCGNTKRKSRIDGE
jgi:fluoride exporter